MKKIKFNILKDCITYENFINDIEYYDSNVLFY